MIGIETAAMQIDGVRDVRVETIAPGHARVVVDIAWWRRRAPVLRRVQRVMDVATPMGVQIDVDAA